MVFIIFLSLLVIIGVPVLVFALIKMAVDAKEMNQMSKLWFIIWLLIVLTIVLLIVFTALLI